MKTAKTTVPELGERTRNPNRSPTTNSPSDIPANKKSKPWRYSATMVIWMRKAHLSDVPKPAYANRLLS